MLDFGFGELLLIGGIALIVLGPKQLPEVARTVGRFVRDIKAIANEFIGSVVDARDSTDRLLRRDPPAETVARAAGLPQTPLQPLPTPTDRAHDSGSGAGNSDGNSAGNGVGNVACDEHRQLSFSFEEDANVGKPSRR